jgi:hypothetical protein
MRASFCSHYKSALITLSLILLLSAAAAHAQTTSFTYQGRLQDGGTNANGTYDFQFTLWDSLSGGTQQPQPTPVTVTKPSVAVSNGVFTVQLDFGATAFPGADRFLEISTRLAGGGSFTTLSPRQQINSTPYAIRSLSAASVDNVPVNAVPAGSGNYIQNTTTPQASANFNITGNGTVGSNLTVNGTLNGNGANLTNLTAANITNGTINGAQLTTPLSLSGNNATQIISAANSGTGLGLQVTSTGSGGLVSRATSATGPVYGLRGDSDSNGGIGVWGFATKQPADYTYGVLGQTNSNFGAAVYGTTTAAIGVQGISSSGIGVKGESSTGIAGYFAGNVYASGNIGIGTAAPTANLTVAQSTSGPGVVATVAGSATLTGTSTQFTNTLQLGDTITVSGQTSTITNILSDTSLTVSAAFTGSGNNLTYTVPGGTRMLVKGYGSVGIGTSAPTSRLHVIGDTNLVGNLTVSGTLTAQLPSGNANYIQNTTSPQGGSNFNISGNGVIGGAVGIGASSPAVALEVRRNSTVAADWQTSQLRISGAADPNMQLGLGYDTSSNLGVIQAGQAFTSFRTLSLNPSGANVGIGTTGPDQSLTVNGGASKPGGGSWATFSDERLKNIKGRFTPGLNAMMRLQPIRYQYKADNALGIKSEGEHIGFGAQAVQKVLPEAVTKDEKGYLLVNNDPIMWTMLNAIKEQQAQIEQQHQQIEGLKKLICRSHRRASVCK